MISWHHGRLQLAKARSQGGGLPLEDFIDSLDRYPPHRVEGVAVFLTEGNRDVPTMLLHHLKHNQVLHERVVMLTLENLEVPRVPAGERFEWQEMRQGFMRLTGRYGFMEVPDVPALLQQASSACNEALFDPMRTSFYLGRESVSVAPGTPLWKKLLLRLFIAQRRNELDATAHFGIPANRVVELGARLELRWPAERSVAAA
jgi:KUP system potassium uptake protein